MINNVEYTTTTNNYYYNCAYGAISSDIYKATSKGFSSALAVLCQNAGIPCLVVPGTKNGISHYWNFVKIDGAWWFVDASLNVPTDDDTYKYKYFLRTMPINYHLSYLLPTVNVSTGSYIKYGDVNQDTEITANDAVLVTQYISNPVAVDISLAGFIAADVTGNSNIANDDSDYILSKVLDSSCELPIETKIKTYT